jgi:beta-galactosidase
MGYNQPDEGIDVRGISDRWELSIRDAKYRYFNWRPAGICDNSSSMVCRSFFVLIPLLFTSAAVFSAPVPLGDAPVPVDRLRVNNPAVLPMTGVWRFQITHGVTVNESYVPHESFVTASSSQDNHPPEDALEDGTDTRWCASGADEPQWWQVDLQARYQLSGLELAWELGDGHYAFSVESSLNGTDWKTIADKSQSPGVGDGAVDITTGPARYLRINIRSAANRDGGGNTWASIRKVKIKVIQDGKEVSWHPKSDARQMALEAMNDFTHPDFDDGGWHDMAVPSNWEMAGYSHPTYNNPDDAAGLYRRWVDVPASFSGQQVLWHFDGVWDSAEIFINGQRVGYHESGFTAFDIDVTSALKPGEKNLFAVRVCKQTKSVDLDTGDFWSLGGIYRENYLVALPQLHVDDITLVTDLDAKYVDATLHATVQVKGPAGTGFQATGHLFTLGGKPVETAEMKQAGKIADDGTAALQFDTPVAAPQLWSAEKPNLYYVVYTLKSGNTGVERVQERFGFRKIEIRKNVLYWNGMPLKCTGTCRHEEWSAIGHALTEHEWQTDAALMKAANINAVRTSHYNHAQRFLEICEEKGFYVLDEVPGCWDDLKDPSLRKYFVQHTRETLARDKNRPCVLAWSLGNESGDGPNGAAMLDYALAHDPTRPAFVSCCDKGTYPRQSFNDFHYPDAGGLTEMATRQNAPDICTEEPHIFFVTGGQEYDYGVNDLWGQVLADVWTHVWPSKSIVGSFVWEWQDQGLADKFPSRDGVDQEGLRSNNHKGIVDGYRNCKPEYFHVKMVYSPVCIDQREVEVIDGKVSVAVQNRYAFTDLGELTCRWQALSGGKAIATGEMHLPCPPQTSFIADLAAPPGMDTLRLEFIHPDGRSIYATRLRVAGTPLAAAPAPLPEKQPLTIKETDQTLTATFAGTELTIDKKTGLINTWRVGDTVVLQGGPILNLGEARKNDGEFGAGARIPFLYSPVPPILKNAVVTSRLWGDVGQISIDSDVFLGSDTVARGHLQVKIDVHGSARLDVAWKVTWTSKEADAWELGLKLPMPSQFDHLTWSRNGQWTEYPADHVGAAEGSATAADLSFHCTKRDLNWAVISGASPYALALLNEGGPLHARANATTDATVLFASSEVAAPWDFSSGFLHNDDIELKPDSTFGGKFSLRIVSTVH